MCACGDGWSRSKRPLEFYAPPPDKRERFSFIQMRINIIRMNENESQQPLVRFILIHLLAIILLISLTFRPNILATFFAFFDNIVARPAQRLPVAAIPEELHVATVRDDVVNHAGRCHPVITLAVDAQGMGIEVHQSRLLPCVTITALGRGGLVTAP